jgi:hypothetical protein
MSSKTTGITNFDKFEQHRLSFTELNDGANKQKLAFVRYDHPTLGDGQQLLLQFPWQKIFTYGVPRLGEYFKEDKDRDFIKFPIDLSNPEMKKLYDELVLLQERLSSEEFRKELFGTKWKKYKFIDICRTPLVDEDDEGPEKPPFMKLKLDTAWPDGEMKTKVYSSTQIEKTDKNGVVKDSDGNPVMTRKRELIEIETVTDFANTVRYMSNVRNIVRPVKLWAQDPKMPEPTFGVTFKIFKIEVEPTTSNGTSLSNYLNDTFLDSDDEETVNTSGVKENTTQSDDSDESDNSDDSDDDSEDNMPPPPVNKKGKRNTKNANS